MNNRRLSHQSGWVGNRIRITSDDKFKVLVVDPPWNQGKTGHRKSRPNQTKTLDYSTLSLDEIKQLPINDWADNPSFIFLWVTNSKDKKTKVPIIKMGFEVLDYWGFTYFTTITWDKKTGPCPFSPFQVSTEHILFGYKGKVQFAKESLGKMKTCFTETSTAHSVKPTLFYENIDQYFDGKKLDVFARQSRVGFYGWGNEYDFNHNLYV